MKAKQRLPSWLRRPMPASQTFNKTSEILTSLGLTTICSKANCPNRGQCWDRGTATVLILGDICTRGCKFCSVAKGKPEPLDKDEPSKIAKMVKHLDLQYLVITSVNRDDLPDGGASHFQNCVSYVRSQSPEVKFEILTPDFSSSQAHAIEVLADALPFTFAHNVETVPSLYSVARQGGDYQRSLNLLRLARKSYKDISIKSSIMLGLGETETQVEQVLKDLLNVGCNRITIGQYLKSSKNSLDVAKYIHPDKFSWWKQKACSMGFSWVISSPFARSSYFAEQENTSTHQIFNNTAL